MSRSVEQGWRMPPARVSWLRIALIAAVAFGAADLFERSSAHDFIETRLSVPLLHHARARAGRAPTIDPRLKIFTFDDSTFAAMRAPDLTLAQWVALLKALDARSPRAIYIDQIFGMTPRSGTDRSKLLGALGEIQAPVVTAAFAIGSTIKLRRKLDLTEDAYRLKAYFRDRDALLKSGFPPLDVRYGWTAYGPNVELVKAFRRVGHALNSGRGFASGLLQLAPGVVLPHMTLLGGDPPKIDRGQLLVDGKVVPLDARGRMVVDFAAPSAYYAHAKRLLPVVKAAMKGEELAQVGPDDTVLILPAMYTGNTDFAETPVGPLPGGFVIASLLNSRLKGAWITPVAGRAAPAWIAVALGVAAATATAGYLSIFVVLLAAAALVAGAAALFAWGGFLTSVTAPLLGFTLAAAAVTVERYRLRERMLLVLRVLKSQNEQMQQELDQAGAVARVFIPAKAPRWDGFTVGAYHRPLTAASGDWYAFESSPSGRFHHMLMCDISGHGAQAAIIVSTCKTVLSMIVKETPASLEREDFVAHYARLLNATLCQHGGGRHTATFLGLTIDPAARQVISLLAGHPRPILVAGRGKKVTHVGKAGGLLGLTVEPRQTLTAQPFGPGDSLLAYTDGVPFPRALGKVLRIFETYRHLDPDSGAKYMAVEAKEGLAVPVPDDDMSLVWIAWREVDAVAMAG